MNYENTTGNRAEQMDAHERELQDVFRERLRQLKKFGPQNRPPYQWYLILAEEVGEVAKELVEMEFDDAEHPHADPERYYKELTEVAAVALAAMQNFNQRRPKAQPLAKVVACPKPTKEACAAAFQRRFGKPERPIEADDIRDMMQIGSELQVQVHVYGFTDWYAVQVDEQGQVDPISLEQLPF